MYTLCWAIYTNSTYEMCFSSQLFFFLLVVSYSCSVPAQKFQLMLSETITEFNLGCNIFDSSGVIHLTFLAKILLFFSSGVQNCCTCTVQMYSVSIPWTEANSSLSRAHISSLWIVSHRFSFGLHPNLSCLQLLTMHPLPSSMSGSWSLSLSPVSCSKIWLTVSITVYHLSFCCHRMNCEHGP